MDDLLSEFLTETAESMDTLDLELVKFEQDPNDEAILGNIFRLVHTIKGTCGFLGLPRLESVAHASENVLGHFRDGSLTVTAGAVTLILESLDRIKEILQTLEETEVEPEGDDSDLIGRLNHLADTGEVPGEGAAPAAEVVAEEATAEEAPAETESVGSGSAALDALMDMDAPAADDNDELQALFDATPYNGPGDPMAAKKAADAASGEDAPAASAAAPSVPAPAKETAPAKAPEPKTTMAAEKKESSGVVQTIRVNVDLLENLMTMVSELVLTRNQLLQILRSAGDSEFNAPLQRLSHVTSELQEGVMKTRMQPIGNAWAKLPRIVRDLSIELDKKIDLQMIGAETELDRQVLDIIKDPLTHMVRNSADHGIEGPEDRVAAGKPETGTITLNAFHEGGHIIIEIRDDGKGLNTTRIRQKCVENGLATESELDAMSEHQIHQFVFAAGFSTAQQVTSVSGRGVGMDVVKTNIDKIGGNVELKSEEGKGSTFAIKIPLTLAIVSALIVECENEKFAIPQISVVELVRSGDNSEHTIENIHGTPVLRIRDVLLPLVSLRKLLNMEESNLDQREQVIVIAQVGTNSFGIIVDKIYDAEEIVVKPVSSILRHIETFSGNTILGDGSVIMILDLNGIAKELGDVAAVAADTMAAEEAQALRGAGADDRVALLVFRAGSESPKAVPLALIARLEEIDFDKVEFTNGQALVQYRGNLMPLVPISRDYEMPTTGKKPTLVFSDRERSMGLVVDEILDIVEDRLNVELSAEKEGMVGSAIINGQASEVIDTGYYLTQAFSDWFGAETEALGAEASKRRVLLVDDSAFFRNLLSPILSVAGYDVTTAESADNALHMCESGSDFDVIVSDIEMPGMNGFEFCSTLRQESRWASTPVIAMTSHTSPGDLEHGREVGFTDYVAKHDRDGLLQALAETLSATN
ncbi:hybrid sensor histidine kinase/response regulator [Curvivirga aplysinae]|uniref:hybrid sensor histidine kinase/response regulator n=1 Tax=Curvivirga aplysinae TaxID=2529852 RepID=UPI0012BD182A|nr:chemotaxis protein CheW [Curvivirga aplysinae]MTI08569.1 hybrid sensor histidine kinase/response regulator [Curvivirga aplysinae]